MANKYYSFSWKGNLGKEITFQKFLISGTSTLTSMKFLRKVKSKTKYLFG